MRKRELRSWEIALLVVSFAVLVSGIGLFATRTSVMGLFSNALRTGKDAEIGRVAELQGVLRREKAGESEFVQLARQAPVYQNDLVMTGASDSAKLELHDGSTIELGPGTMIRLVNESQFTLSGIVRMTRVQLVEGEVRGASLKGSVVVRDARGKSIALDQVKKAEVRPQVSRMAPSPRPLPSPSPTPTLRVPQVRLFNPAEGEKISVERGSRKAAKTVRFVWSADVPEVEFLLTRLGPGEPRQVVLRPVRHETGEVALDLELKESGDYEWQIRTSGKSWTSRFSLLPDFEAISLRAPLVSGAPLADNRFLGGKSKRPFDVTVRWESFPGATEYSVWIDIGGGNSEPVKGIRHTNYRIKDPKVMARPFRYRVTADLPGGFIVASKTESFQFQIFPPAPSSPHDGEAFPAKRLLSEKGLLLTWEKRNFSTGYLVEIARDPGFKDLVVKTNTRENFYPIRSFAPGKYYWRVAIVSEAGLTGASPPISFTITP